MAFRTSVMTRDGYGARAMASRNCRFITLPLALRGSGSVVSAIVSGTL